MARASLSMQSMQRASMSRYARFSVGSWSFPRLRMMPRMGCRMHVVWHPSHTCWTPILFKFHLCIMGTTLLYKCRDGCFMSNSDIINVLNLIAHICLFIVHKMHIALTLLQLPHSMQGTPSHYHKARQAYPLAQVASSGFPDQHSALCRSHPSLTFAEIVAPRCPRSAGSLPPSQAQGSSLYSQRSPWQSLIARH